MPSGGGGASAAPATGGGAAAAAAETKEEEKKEEKVRAPFRPFLSDLTLIHRLCRKSLMTIWASVCSIRMKSYRSNATVFLA